MIDRRSLMGFMAAGAPFGWKAQSWAAEESGKGVFWRLEVPGKGKAVVFGGWAVAASAAPEILRDGYILVQQTQRMFGQYPDFQSLQVDLSRSRKLVETVSPGLARELRVIVEAIPGSGPFENFPASMTALVLITEGQTRMTPTTPTLAFTMRSFAQQLQRPFSFLVSESEAKDLLGAPDLAIVDKAVNDALVSYVLELRRQRGPLGKYVEQLYNARDSEGLQRFNDDLYQHGMDASGISENRVLRLRKVLLERMLEAVGSQPGVPFFGLELVALTGKNGLFAGLRRQGVTISVLA